MKKELIICLLIITLIIITNIITQNYTQSCISKMNERIDIISQVVYEKMDLEPSQEEKENNNKKEAKESEKIDKSTIQGEVDNLESTWNEFQEKLAYYIEHDELEKVETQIYAIKGFCEVEKYDEILPEAEKCSFILKHIGEKTKLSVKNIF